MYCSADKGAQQPSWSAPDAVLRIRSMLVEPEIIRELISDDAVAFGNTLRREVIHVTTNLAPTNLVSFEVATFDMRVDAEKYAAFFELAHVFESTESDRLLHTCGID